ncbi:MAG: DUF2834 domain-containing protein [Gammaproteobacteria bacterium]
MRRFYALMCVIGVLPWWPFTHWLQDNPFHVLLFLHDAMENGVSAAAWLDLIITYVVLVVFIIVEGRRLAMNRLWLPILGATFIGLSFGLPLFLWMREGYLSRNHSLATE